MLLICKTNAINQMELLNILKEKAKNCGDRTKESRARKGAYVDCIVMLKNIQESEDIKGLDNPFPLKDVLKKLVDAADILLHEKKYDGTNYEEIEMCVKRAKEIIKLCEKI